MGNIVLNDGLKQPKDNITKLKGVVDFGNLSQFDLYEKGYGLLAVINGPYCLSSAFRTDGYATLQDRFISVLENEFRGLSGLDDMTGDTSEITDGISTINIITKVTEQSAAQVTINLLREKSGRLISKYTEAFLRCVKDPRSQYKTYLGMINADNVNEINPGFDKEVFNMLYIVTDNTALRVEGAYVLLCAQPTQSDLSMLESERGSYDFVDVSLPFNAFPVRSKAVNKLADTYLRSVNINRDSTEFNWSFSTGDGSEKSLGSSSDGNIVNGATNITFDTEGKATVN